MEAKGETSGKEANEEMKKEGESGNAYEMIDITPTETTPTTTDPSSTADLEGMYENESASSQSVPAVPPSPDTDKKEEEDEV